MCKLSSSWLIFQFPFCFQILVIRTLVFFFHFIATWKHNFYLLFFAFWKQQPVFKGGAYYEYQSSAFCFSFMCLYVFMSSDLKTFFTGVNRKLPDFSRWFVTSRVGAATTVCILTRNKCKPSSSGAVFLPISSAVEEDTLREFNAEQVWHLFWRALGLHLLAKADRRMEKLFPGTLVGRCCSIFYVDAFSKI